MIDVIIQARLGSNRFPGKVLKKINGKPMLLYQVERVKKSKLINKVIVATTRNPIDKKILDLCDKHEIDTFIGSEHDVIKRYYDCAKAFKTKVIVRVTSDCPFADPRLIDRMIQKFLSGNYDYLANTVPPELRRWPDGSDVEIFNFKSLKKAVSECKSRYFREHVTFYFWKSKKKNIFKVDQFDNKNDWSKYRFTVDYKEDLTLVRKVSKLLSNQKKFGHVEDIVNILKKNENIFKINSKYYFGIGWETNKKKI